MDVGTQPSNTGGYQTGLPPAPSSLTFQIGTGGVERPHIPPHGQGSDAGMATPNRKSGGPILRLWGDPECGACHGGGVCSREEAEVGGYLDRPRILCGGEGIFPGTRVPGGGGERGR